MTKKLPATTKPEAASQPNAGPDDRQSNAAAAPGGLYPTGLYVVATPIGNLGDLSARAIATLKAADVVACEDTRVTAVLLRRFGIATPMTAYHDHNAERVRPKLLAQLREGATVALVSDAGTPLISDPGYKLVKECVESGIAVVPIPGPSAPLAALMAAGLPTDRFYFGGFLPQKSAARRSALEDVKSLKATLVFFESPHRLATTLADMAQVLGERPAAVGREITKLHEEFKRGPLGVLARDFGDGNVRGEIVIVVDGADEQPVAIDVEAALRDALKTSSVRDAAETVSKLTGQPRREIYARALAIAQAKSTDD
ncbi:MAG: 16S rRNA (cytidine(1402)-2'-O)-methyltransferase [Rhodospirillaceae bacterium]|nr:16S rRNA (cytidine(1402)-2'-O)-methyltransferase [Rhodospirillaceae bacterium]